MAKNNKPLVSLETQNEALAMAKKTQKPGQTKEQTKLIAQGIQKGIAEYKKLAKSKQRDADRAKKKNTSITDTEQTDIEIPSTESASSFLPWALLGCSWVGFISYYFLNK
jgi:hypothetical protein